MANSLLKMRSIIQRTASSKTLTLTNTHLPTPNHAQGEHLIQIKACSPCTGELLWPANFPPLTERTLIPCPDMAGLVISAPEDSPFQPGDEVYARTDYVRPGNARDYSIAATYELAHKPKCLSWVQAAAVPVSAETAWQVLFVHALAKGNGEEMDMGAAKAAWAGKRVLITAASGGVGIWLVQLATLLGAEVIATCGSQNVDFVKSLGAKEVLDYRVADLKEWATKSPSNKVDVVVDCVGGKALADAWFTVKDGGVVLSIYQPPSQVRPEDFKGESVKDLFFVMQPVRSQLEEISKLIEKGVCRGLVDSVWPLEQYEEAFKRLDGGHAKGKIVFDLSLNQ
ncbi:Polyketide synthase, enoylreductase [Penicillium griseofulvum]|uniref:Polyketide synthase, enoylreductase n=1 Tax=Penicillium patulum TaxID=5078 RepID=A0A135LNW5_PENPA|nr:Polyketide synthase, enoylreductase [Penicillium griseofulvum]KXG50643.1 Polyketide synthase, enoylreductase [Penicillium griseofulvum]